MKYYIVKVMDGTIVSKQQISCDDLLNMQMALKPSAKSYREVDMKKEARQIMHTFDKLRAFTRAKLNLKAFKEKIKL